MRRSYFLSGVDFDFYREIPRESVFTAFVTSVHPGKKETLRFTETNPGDVILSASEVEKVNEAVGYLRRSYDLPDAVCAVYIPPAEMMRRQASEMERKDALISEVRDILTQAKERMEKG